MAMPNFVQEFAKLKEDLFFNRMTMSEMRQRLHIHLFSLIVTINHENTPI